MPVVASEACCRKTVESDEVVVGEEGRGICRMSIGMARRWHAKIAFMMGMYWWARSVEGEAVMRRIRDWILFLSSDSPVLRVLLLESAEATPVRDSE